MEKSKESRNSYDKHHSMILADFSDSFSFIVALAIWYRKIKTIRDAGRKPYSLTSLKMIGSRIAVLLKMPTSYFDTFWMHLMGNIFKSWVFVLN